MQYALENDPLDFLCSQPRYGRLGYMVHVLGKIIVQRSKARHQQGIGSIKPNRKRYKRISMFRRQKIGNIPLAQRSKCNALPAHSHTIYNPPPQSHYHPSQLTPHSPSSIPPKSSPPTPPASSYSPTSSSPPHLSPPKISQNSISRASCRRGQARLLSDIRKVARRWGR